MTAQLITPALFDFLRELGANNERPWFEENKARYRAEVRDPMLDFIQAFAEPLAEISPHFRADPRANGGSLFRIYRDTRFSKDKTPYKTNVGAHFRHEAGKDAHAPGFYLHLEPGMCFAGCGVWHPDSPTLGRIRDTIVEKPEEWTRITTGEPLTHPGIEQRLLPDLPPGGRRAQAPAARLRPGASPDRGPQAQGFRRDRRRGGGRGGPPRLPRPLRGESPAPAANSPASCARPSACRSSPAPVQGSRRTTPFSTNTRSSRRTVGR